MGLGGGVDGEEVREKNPHNTPHINR